MISFLLCTALLSPPALQEPAPPPTEMVVVDVGHLTGASELGELRAAIVRDDLPVSVRRAALDRYTELLKGGQADSKAQELAGNIEHFVTPSDDSRFQVEPLSASELAVTGSAAQIEWVNGFIEQMRTANLLGALVDIGVEIYRLPTGNRERLTGGRSGLTLDHGELDALKSRLKNLKGVSHVTSPRITLHVGAKGNVSVINQTAYIRDFELTILPDLAQEVLDPVVDVINEGLVINLRALAVAEGTLMVSTDFSSSSLRRPIREVKRKFGPSYDDVTIQLPEVKTVTASAKFELKDDAAIVLSTIDPGFDDEEPEDLLIVIRAELLLPIPGNEPLAPAGKR